MEDSLTNIPSRPTGEEDLLLIDAHVHIHDCFAPGSFLSAAWSNFAAEARRRGERTFRGVLMLSESAWDDAFGRLAALADSGEPAKPEGGWRFEHTAEPCSLRGCADDGRELWVVAGRQIVTEEGIEVLALGTDARFQDGAPLAAVVELVRDADAFPVLPWGFGKWLGERGRILTDYLARSAGEELALGDNSGRPVFWVWPFHFRLAERRGIPILPGSDPLPFASESGRAGSFGFAAHGVLDRERPAASLKQLLRESVAIEPYGRRESPLRFVRNQLAMQWVKRRRPAAT